MNAHHVRKRRNGVEDETYDNTEHPHEAFPSKFIAQKRLQDSTDGLSGNVGRDDSSRRRSLWIAHIWSLRSTAAQNSKMAKRTVFETRMGDTRRDDTSVITALRVS